MYKGKGTAQRRSQEGQTVCRATRAIHQERPGLTFIKAKVEAEGTGEGSGLEPALVTVTEVAFHTALAGEVQDVHNPPYDSKEQGKVVVTIKVDRNGKVTSAVAGAKGTNVSHQTLWQLAKDAALKSRRIRMLLMCR